MQEKLGGLIDHKLVGEVRGVGLVTGIEMVADKTTRAQFDPALQVGAMVDRHAREHGLITRFVGDRIAFSPPLVITEAIIDEAVERITLALDDAWADLVGSR
jgi:4-aminobutyrate---pyruvate transaminase